MHRAHQELTQRAAQIAEANLLIHPVVGLTKPGDVDHFARVRCYEQVLKTYPEQTTLLSLLPLAMRMAGPARGGLARDHPQELRLHPFHRRARPRRPRQRPRGQAVLRPYDAQELLQELEPEIGIQMVPFKEMAYVQDRGQYVPQDEVEPGETVLNLPAPSSGGACARASRSRPGSPIPRWSRSCAGAIRPSTARASRCCSPASPAPANRRSRTP